MIPSHFPLFNQESILLLQDYVRIKAVASGGLSAYTTNLALIGSDNLTKFPSPYWGGIEYRIAEGLLGYTGADGGYNTNGHTIAITKTDFLLANRIGFKLAHNSFDEAAAWEHRPVIVYIDTGMTTNDEIDLNWTNVKTFSLDLSIFTITAWNPSGFSIINL